MTSLDQHLNTYNRPEVVNSYAKAIGLHAYEAYLFDKYVESGDAILDIGVGGGRTTPWLSDRGAKYIGVDYSQSMVAACKRKFPALEFYCENACDLRRFEDAIFDVVVFSYNGIDCIGTYEARMACLREIFRVLKSGGRFIFSSHNAKQLGFWPELHNASLLRKIVRIFKSPFKSILQCVNRFFTQAFREGSGYVFTIAESKSRLTFVSTPDMIKKDASTIGFTVAEVVNNLYPQEVPKHFTEWYNYVLVKP